MRRRLPILLIALSAATVPANATDICQNLEGTHLIVGEARVTVLPDSSNEVYVNAYFDGGDQLDMGAGDTAGGVGDVSSDNLWIYAYVFGRDAANDNYFDTWYRLELYGGNSRSNNCPSGTQTYYASTWTIDYSSHDIAELFWGGHMIGFGGINAKRHWKNILTANLFGDSNSDYGCFDVDDQYCTLEEHF